MVDNESMVSVLRLVDSSMVVIMKKLLARMTVTRRTKAKSAKSCTLRDCPRVVDLGYIDGSSRCKTRPGNLV